MTNSVKKSPCYSFCSGSNGYWKRLVNREFRRINKQNLHSYKELLIFDEVANMWTAPSDGLPTYLTGVKLPIKVLRCGAIRYKVPRTDTGYDFWDTRDIFWK